MQPPPLDPDNHALFLDFDGTLVGFAETPDSITVTDDLKQLLVRLESAFAGAFALVTGRAADNLAGHLERPFLIAGSHGAEIREKDGATQSLAKSDLREPLKEARAFQRANPSLVLEEKAGGLTLHFRREPSLKEETLTFLQQLFGQEEQLEIIAGSHMWEVREKSLHKGSAIEALLQRPVFEQRLPIFIGDDVTDEDGFHAVNEAGGVSVKVGQGETSAKSRLADISAVRSWLLETVSESTS